MYLLWTGKNTGRKNVQKKNPAINGSIGIRLPLGFSYLMEANVLRLREEGVDLTPMKMAYIEYSTPLVQKKAEREKILAELNADDRVLFAFMEYSS